MARPKVYAVPAAALTIVAIVFLILDGPRAAVYPAVTAICCVAVIYLDTRYPNTLKQWTTRRIVETTAITVLVVALLVGGAILSRSASSSWAFLVTTLVMLTVAVPLTAIHLATQASRADPPADRAPNGRGPAAGPTR